MGAMSMDTRAYSTIIDAIIFLAMVSVCALILSAAISSAERARAESDTSMRSLASSTLASMETAKVDYFQYRILGDRTDQVAQACGIDPEAKLYRDTANALLGRGNRHKTVMELAAEDAACQFTLHYDNNTLKLNPLTGDYDRQTSALVDGFVRGRIDERYGYQFSLRWVPFSGVPLEGSIVSGESPPEGAASASAYVTMPYATRINKSTIQAAIAPDLEEIENATDGYMKSGDKARFKGSIRSSLDRCLKNSSALMVAEIWNDTIGQAVPDSDVRNPLKMLGAFSDNNIPADAISIGQSFDVDETICSMVVACNADGLDALADAIVEGESDGSMDAARGRDLILSWMQSRYNPSRARATISVWVSGHDA
jgi:hypothetical protein